MGIVTLYSGSVGLNTTLDPQRLSQGTKDRPGHIELAQAVNVSIDDRGLVTLRNGDTLATDGEFHSVFCDGGDCFVVQERESDAAIMQVGSDLTTSGIRSGLSVDRGMAWCQVNADTFYSNGVQNGFIRSGISSAWPVGTYRGPDADISFETSVPVADHIAFIPGGKMLLAEGAAIWINHLPFQFGLYSKRLGYIGLGSNVRMIAPVQSGFFASDESKTWFFRKVEGGWYTYKQELAEDVPALEWSLAHDKVSLRDVGIDSDNFGRIWASEKGICLGTDDGQFINLTKEQINYPSGHSRGACLVKGGSVIHTVY